MNKVLLIIFCTFILSGCGMSRTEIITAAKECTDAGWDFIIVRNELVNRPIDVECRAKSK